MRVSELLEPVVAAMRADLLRASQEYKPTKRLCRCRCVTAEAPIIRRICGNTEPFPTGRAARRCSIFN